MKIQDAVAGQTCFLIVDDEEVACTVKRANNRFVVLQEKADEDKEHTVWTGLHGILPKVVSPKQRKNRLKMEEDGEVRKRARLRAARNSRSNHNPFRDPSYG